MNAWRSSTIERRLLRRFEPLDDREARALLRQAWLLRTIEQAIAAGAAAWRASATRRGLRAAAGGDTGMRIEAAGWVAIGASLTRVALVDVEGLVRPAGIGLGWGVVFAVGVLCAWRPQAVAAALAGRRRRPGATDRR